MDTKKLSHGTVLNVDLNTLLIYNVFKLSNWINPMSGTYFSLEQVLEIKSQIISKLVTYSTYAIIAYKNNGLFEVNVINSSQELKKFNFNKITILWSRI